MRQEAVTYIPNLYVLVAVVEFVVIAAHEVIAMYRTRQRNDPPVDEKAEDIP